jgi:hypothetical protein
MGLVAEQVDVRDLERAYYLLQEVIINAMYPITVHPDSIVNGNRSFPGNELSRIREKRRAWNATAKWVEPRLKIGHPFPENLFERTRMGIGSLKAKLNTES